jgi:hypothetical protein
MSTATTWAPTFTDTAGRVWSVVVTDDVVRQVGAEPLARLFAELCAGRLRPNGRTVADVLYTCCEAQTFAARVAPEDFFRALCRLDVIERAALALMAAIGVRRIGVAAAVKLFDEHTGGK